MAEGVVSFGVQKLWELLGRESERLLGVHEKVDDLKLDRRGLSMDIEGITKRMAKVVGQMQSFGIQQIIYRSPSLQERQRPRENRQTYPKRSQKDLVGVEQSVNELVGHLVENDNIQVVSISGMGGIGKTTLARQVFHHDIVRSHFDGFAWICVSQDFKKKDIWQKLLQELRPHDTGIEQMNEDTLQAKIFHSLETSKYLIVMDDVWKNEDWDKIKDVFPQERGWKMILTSRNEGVGLHADPSCFPFRPKILTPEESWKLCESIAFPRREITVTAQWKRLPISNDEPPPPRAYHTMTSIGARHLLVGGFDGKSTFGDLWWLVPEDDPIAKRSSVPQIRNPPETKESERELDTRDPQQERGQEGSTIVDLQKKMGISVSSGLLRLQIPEESEDQEFVELGTRLTEGDVVDNRASMIQMAAEALRQHWRESTPETLQLKELGSLLRDYHRLVTRKYTAQGSLASADFGLPGKKTFTFYHIKSSSELRMDDIPKLLEEYKTLVI
ncbi:hypothetical protein F2Q70_00024986 [Brassica cretica]|uniref:NB-ARC domain-containing protein n=1 Tax=Brassica cretica TaxID=69181 RepID=A0A8S9L5D1_BRACR|nr:hypothetical protein F2Q70_00024986 [Brassica cretica]